MEHEDLVEALEGRRGSRKSARDAVDAFAGAILAEVASPRCPASGCSIRSAPAQADRFLGSGVRRPFARLRRPVLALFRLTRRVKQRDASRSRTSHSRETAHPSRSPVSLALWGC